jgi:hypothetical protein
MARYWCLNYDFFPVLCHGLDTNTWMMQYQYACQGRRNQQHKKNRLTANWRGAQRIEVGDLCLAYLKPNGFYAAGEVTAPRKPSNNVDTVVRTLEEDRHEYLDGIVYYGDTQAFYEDHTDRFRYSNRHEKTKQIEHWPYAQKVDVIEWRYKRKASNGAYISISVDGLEKAVERCNKNKDERGGNIRKCCMRDVVIEIDLAFYRDIEEKLRLQAFRRHIDVGASLQAAKKYAGAAKECQEALKIFPDDAGAKAALKRAQDGKP